MHDLWNQFPLQTHTPNPGETVHCVHCYISQQNTSQHLVIHCCNLILFIESVWQTCLAPIVQFFFCFFFNSNGCYEKRDNLSEFGNCKQSDFGTMYRTVMCIHHRLKSGLEIFLARHWTVSQNRRPAESDFGAVLRKSSKKRHTRRWKEMGDQPSRSISPEFCVDLVWQCRSESDNISQPYCTHACSRVSPWRNEAGRSK